MLLFWEKVSQLWSYHQISHLNFPCSAFRFFVFDEYQSALIPTKLSCPGKVLVMRLYYNDLSAEKHIKKIMKMLNVSVFSFIILNLVKKGILDTL